MTGGSHLVTVVTNAHNAELYIAEAIESVLRQSIDDWEYVIVDDASSDATARIAERYAETDSRIRVIRRSQRGGPYAAANQGIADARGRYIARLDADDVAVPHRLERQLTFLSARSELRACAATVKLLVDGELRDHDLGVLPVLPGSLKWRFVVRWGFIPSTTFMEKAAFDEIGGFRELELSQDHRMWCELARRRWLGCIEEPLAYWRIHPEQLTAIQQPLQERLGKEAIRDHLNELTGMRWTDAEVYHLRSIGERPVPLATARRLMNRFEQSWRADATLDDAERAELERLTARLRREHLRVWINTPRRALVDRLERKAWGRSVTRRYRSFRR